MMENQKETGGMTLAAATAADKAYKAQIKRLKYLRLKGDLVSREQAKELAAQAYADGFAAGVGLNAGAESLVDTDEKILIVAGNEVHARSLAKRLPHSLVKVEAPSFACMSSSPHRVIVAYEAANLDHDHAGKGVLRDILRRRQMTYGDRTVLLEV